MSAEVASGEENPTKSLPSHPSDARILALDGWRGLAIVTVLIGHFVGRVLVPEVNWLGQTGVELFLVLSGRLMAEILIFRRQPVGWFLLRRASRIMPTLVVYVAVVSLFLIAMGQGAKIWMSALGAVGLFHNYLPQSSVSGLFEHSWSVAVEEHSYLLLAAMALLLRRNSAAIGIVGLLVIGLALANGTLLEAAPLGDAQFPSGRSDVRVASILIGFVVFLRLREGLEKLGPMAALVSPLSLGLGLAISASSEVHWVRYGIGTLCLAVSVGSVERSYSAFRRVFETQTLMWFGTISYSLYLWQQVFFGLAQEAGLNALLALSMAVATAAWSYARIENPARAALNDNMYRWRLTRAKLVSLPA